MHWRWPRAKSGAGKYDSEWHEGIFLGVSGAEVVIGTPFGIRRSRDVRRVAGDDSWSKEMITQCTVSFCEYMCPEDGPQTTFEIPVMHREADDVPDVDFATKGKKNDAEAERFRSARFHGRVSWMHRTKVGQADAWRKAY